MSRPLGAPLRGRVSGRVELSEHLVRLSVSLTGLVSSGVPDEWVALTVPEQYQTRYYTVRSLDGETLTLDVVLHAEGLVTEWARTRCIGDDVGISVPSGSFAPPEDTGWLVLVGDLTALPAIARITAETRLRAVTSYLEAPEGTAQAYPDPPRHQVSWQAPPGPGRSRLADLVRGIAWPAGPGYFWMAGESAQMREIRRHLRQEVGLPPARFDVMGYWSGSRGRRSRAADPGPVYARGRALGKSDEEIWAEYDAVIE